ncbi:hypothetical protein D3C80_2002400 [compost metagenome]
MLVDEHQVIRTIRPLQHFAGLVEHQVQVALGIADFKVHAEVIGGRLHELRITRPEGFVVTPRIEKNHGSGAQRLANAQAEAQ